MSIQAAIRTQLVDDATVAEYVTARVYPATAIPQSARPPWITYQRITGGPIQASDGPTSTQNIRLQINCDSTTYPLVVALANAVKAALDGWTRTYGDPNITGCTMTDEHDDYEAEATDSGQHIQRVTQEYSIWFS